MIKFREIYEKITKRLLIETVILIIVFSVSLTYSLNKNQTFLVPECDLCDGKCVSYTTLRSGILSGNYDLNTYLESETGREYSFNIFSGNFSSCSISNPEEFIAEGYMGDEIVEIRSVPYPSLNNFSDSIFKNIQIKFENCFEINCNIKSMPGYGPSSPHIVIKNKTINTIKVHIQLVVQKTNVIANCIANVNDQLFTFFSASNTFTESDVYKCVTNNDIIVAFGVSLTYVLTTLSVIKYFHYFHKMTLNESK